MAQTLNGHYQPNDAPSYAVNVGQWRHAISDYNFGVDGGAQGAFTVFTVTGDVLISAVGLCHVLMDSGGAATIELGIAGNTACLVAQTPATDLDANEIWQDAVPDVNGMAADVLNGGARQNVIIAGEDVIFTVGAADLTAGYTAFHAFWMPLSVDGNVAAA